MTGSAETGGKGFVFDGGLPPSRGCGLFTAWWLSLDHRRAFLPDAAGSV